MNRIILFDVMGTLVYDPYLVELPAFFGMTFTELIQNKDRTVWPRFERSEISEEEFLEHYFPGGERVDAAGLRAHLTQAYRMLDGIEPMLERLRDRGVEMHAFSNYPEWYGLIESKLTLSRFLEWSFVSADTGFRKPEAQAYEHAIETLGVDPEQLVFVDDRESNVNAAVDAGMNGIVFEGSDQLEKRLIDLV